MSSPDLRQKTSNFMCDSVPLYSLQHALQTIKDLLNPRVPNSQTNKSIYTNKFQTQYNTFEVHFMPPSINLSPNNRDGDAIYRLI